jgi:SAM-dependent methyltransferase
MKSATKTLKTSETQTNIEKVCSLRPLPACPRCRGEVEAVDHNSLKCVTCQFVIELKEGIWRALPAERESYFSRFIREYELVRQAEGRGSSDPNYYLALPYRDLSGKLSWQWKIRRKSYQALIAQILPELEQKHPAGLDLLDMGAGNGWLSYRLALRNHRPVAVDLLVNDLDGLGAARHYRNALPEAFPRFQAEMDHLPFADAQFDLVMFNASLHYSTDYTLTLTEALRCLKAGGELLILDSPVYQHEESGLAMRREKHQQFARQHGFRSESIPSREFLTYDLLQKLADDLGLTWRWTQPWYGLVWAIRPWKAKLQGKREPSTFLIVRGKRKAP